MTGEVIDPAALRSKQAAVVMQPGGGQMRRSRNANRRSPAGLLLLVNTDLAR
jgi:hypothetical protein